MRKKETTVVLLLILFFITGMLTGCGQTDQQQSDAGNTFIIARTTDAGTLDCGYAYSEGEIDLMYHLYDGLVSFKNDDLEVEPALAESWELSEDGNVWTFNLRQDVKFHDGTHFDADAVVFNYERLINVEHPYYGLGDYSYFDYLLGDVVEKVEAIDAYTVQISLKEKFAPFLTYMGYYSEFIASPAAIQEYGAEYFKHPVGTGPFRFEEWKNDEYIKMAKNDDYWGTKPEIDTLIWKVVPDDSTRLMELESGQVNAIKPISPNQMEKVKSNDKLVLEQVAGANLFYVAFNTMQAPFDDIRVRQALNYAIDMDQLVQSTYDGMATRAINPMPPTVMGFNDKISAYSYDPEKAKKLLTEAGYPDGFDMELNTFVNARPYVARPIDTAEIIKNDLAKVGVNVKINTNEWGTHQSIMDNMEHQATFNGWYDIPYPSNFLKAMLLLGSNTGYEPENVSALAQKALATYDKEEQISAYEEIQAIAHEDAPIIPIAHSDYTAVVAGNVEGFKLDVLGNVNIKEVHFK